MARTARISLLIVLLLAVCCPQAFGTSPFNASALRSQAAPMPYDGSSDQARARHSYSARWGRYTVRVDGAGKLDQLRVLDAAGRVLREVMSEDILTVDYPVLQPGHPPALRVLASAGGVAESSERTYLFSCERGVRNLLVLTGEIAQIRHRSGGAMADLLVDSSVPLEYFTGFSHSGCGNVTLVMRWAGSRYALAGRRSPLAARRRAQADRQELVGAAASERRDPEQVGAALGSCANLWTVGQGSGYYGWLRAHMTRSGWRWFLAAQPELRRRMTAVGRMVSLSQRRVFVLTYPRRPWPCEPVPRRPLVKPRRPRPEFECLDSRGRPPHPVIRAVPTPAEYDAAPYRARWGPYTVTVENLDELHARLRIQNRRGDVLREVRAVSIDTVDYPRLNRHGPAALRVYAQPLVNILGDRRTFVFTRAGSLRNVLVMPEGFDAVLDLGHDGRRELIVDTVAPLENVADVCHACSPDLTLALGWDGHRYVSENRRFPWLARRKARFYQQKFLWARDHPDDFPDHQIAPAVGYWANMETVGDGRPALHWLMRKMPRWARRSFLEALPDVRARLARLPRQITVSQQRVFVVSEDGSGGG